MLIGKAEAGAPLLGLLMRRADSLENELVFPTVWEILNAKKERGKREMKLLDSITDSMDMNLSKL